ncbi:RHS repeat-associated core domain-containing protein [Roseimaritima sediminicola]|uniref:RHS repeat-associated core domain-containing protein n=1 Tax=Roseimaritima sediminicola TaxID=2662066 RepID=UPI00129835B9|nr:RHS repeat-associated core domain-containing protein [Roseimaritima sediminicola]
MNQLVTEGKVYGSGTQNRSYAYDAAGNLRSLVDRNDRRTEWAYDNRYRVSSETWRTCASVDRTLTYAYDTSDRTTSIDDSDPLATDFQFAYDNRLVEFASYRDGTETSYGYDSRDQLTSATTAAITGLSQPFGLASSESYDFDAGGNRKSSGGSSQSASHTHNQLQTDGTYNYTYDDEGNTLSKTSIATGEVTEYAWDHRNRLVLVTERVSAGGTITQQVEFIYDAFDQRVGKRVDSDGDGTWDRDEAFVWADGQTVLRFVDSDGEAVSESFRIANRYLYGDAVDEVLADEQYAAGSEPAVNSSTASTTAGETLWTIADHLGSVRDLVDNNGVVRQHVAYDSFGNRLVEQDYDASGTAIASSHASAVDTLFGYTGRDWDADVELQNNRARWYDPTTGRWLSQDPIGFAAGDANLYRYVGNGPTTKIDPSGLEWVTSHSTVSGPLVWIYTGVWEVDTEIYYGATDQGGESVKENPARTALMAGAEIDPTPIFPICNEVINGGIEGKPAGQIGQDILVNAAPGPNPNIAKKIPGVKRLFGAVPVNKIDDVADAPNPTAATRATEIHQAVPAATQRRTTVAVTETAQGTRIVSSSEKRLRPAQRRLLGPNEVEGVGLGHAEVTGVNAAGSQGLTPTGTAASRPTCPSCDEFLQQNKVAPLSPLKKPRGGK